MRDEALWRRADQANLFAEVDPNQKERIISALRKTGHVVGYMGDGINDAPALHAADVGISVDTAVDVAKEAADFVLLEQDLDVLRQGIEQGRQTFANTLKYVFTTTSANFGNMFSMAGLSLFLPFLPLLPKQILLNNFLSDFPAMTIATDDVDPEMVDRPRRWDVDFIRKFMIVFGLVSSVFDYLTFGVLLLVLRARRTEVPHRLVHRIAADRAVHPAGGAHPPAAVQEQAGALAVGQHAAGRDRRRRLPLPAAARAAVRLRAAAAADDGAAAGDHFAVCGCQRGGEADLLPESAVLIGKRARSWAHAVVEAIIPKSDGRRRSADRGHLISMIVGIGIDPIG